jgi:hypothetical protein
MSAINDDEYEYISDEVHIDINDDNNLDDTFIINFIRNIDKAKNYDDISIKKINKSIKVHENKQTVFTIEFIRSVTKLLIYYSGWLQLLKNYQETHGTDEYISIDNQVLIINYEKIRNNDSDLVNLKHIVERIAKKLKYLSQIKLKLQVFINSQPISVDGDMSNKLFGDFGIKTTTDLSKFVIQGAGGTRKKRRRKTSKSTKKHRKSSRRRS